MGVGRVKEEKGVVWQKIEKKVPKVSEEKRFFFLSFTIGRPLLNFFFCSWF